MSDNRSPVNPTPAERLHTPGPWRLWTSKIEPGVFTIHGDSPHTVEGVSSENMVIASRMIGTPVGMEGVANAHLIAAAPELLAALKMIVQTHLASCKGEDCHVSGIDLANAAIAKAEGWTL